MSKPLNLAIAALILVSNSVLSQWTQKADFGGGGRYEAFGFSINDKGYIGGGRNATGAKKDFWEYDPATNTWSQKADLGSETGVAAGYSIGDKGYVVSGLSKQFWEYDPVANTWVRKADFGGVGRGVAVGFSIGTKGYFGTGSIHLGGELKDFWEYDPSTDTWTQKADVGGFPRWYATGFSIGNKGYIGTGNSSTSPDWDLKDFWEYDPATNIWTRKVDFGGGKRYGAVGFSIGDKGYLGTGYENVIGFKTDFWEYDQSANTWLQKEDFPGTRRFSAVGFSISNDKGYIGTGLSGALADFWEYSPCDQNATVSAGPDRTLYFGYLPEQCVSITAAVTGGASPYSFQWTLDRPLLSDVITADGDESLSGANSQTVTICLLDTANLCVTVTDANGCTFTDCVAIFASDVRCFAGNNNVKVNVCHNGNMICVDENAVAVHLSHGDLVGPCVTNRANVGLVEIERNLKAGFNVYPNPNKGDLFVTMSLTADETKDATIQVINVNGQIIKKINVNNQHRLNFSIKETGIYFIKLITNKQIYTKKITVME